LVYLKLGYRDFIAYFLEVTDQSVNQSINDFNGISADMLD